MKVPGRLASWFLCLVALRLLAWVLLLPPWSGFDEPFHHSLVLDQAERLRWFRFRETRIQPQLVAEIRRWRVAGPYRFLSAEETNHETQQSPLYYWVAGLALRPFRTASPIATLYALRLANAALAFAAILITSRVARRLFGDRDWIPLAYLGLVPGLGIALTRVCNDALAAAAISAAMAGALGFSAWWTLAAGVAPWAKLYGAAVIPATFLPLRDEQRPQTFSRAAGIVVAFLFLLVLSLRIHGHVFPIQENLHSRAPISLTEVSWGRNVWTIAKSHVFFSGFPVHVFPKWVYVVAFVPIAAAALASFRRCRAEEAKLWTTLLLPLLFFVGALLYHSWRTSSFFGTGGATGGWYLWAMLLPESIFVSAGIAFAADLPRWPLSLALLFFLGLTVAGDLILIASGGSLLVVRDAAVGMIHPAAALRSFLNSRPVSVAAGALAAAGVSWLVAVFAIRRALRRPQNPPRCASA